MVAVPPISRSFKKQVPTRLRFRAGFLRVRRGGRAQDDRNEWGTRRWAREPGCGSKDLRLRLLVGHDDWFYAAAVGAFVDGG